MTDNLPMRCLRCGLPFLDGEVRGHYQNQHALMITCIERLRAENMRLQSLADNLAHDAGQLRRDGIRLRAALSDALHELASQRHGAAMTLIEGALDKDGDA